MSNNNNNIQDTTTGISWLEKVLVIGEKYKITTILKSIVIILFLALTVGFVRNPSWIFEQYNNWQEQQHTEKLTHRLQHNEKIHILTEKLLYKVNADRVLLLELHNGNQSLSGFPFAKCSATYEALNDGIIPVANEYQELNLSLMPFATTLFENNFWCGNTEDLKEIDKALCYRMLGHDTSHFAGIVIKGVDKPLAFLFVKFKDIGTEHDCDDIKKMIEETSYQIALLLELNRN